MTQSMLVLGGTGFISRVFCERVLSRSHLQLTLLNRGLSSPQLFEGVAKLTCDRNDADACAATLEHKRWDYIVDFSGYSHAHVENVVANCRFKHYTYLSTSAVELSWPEDELFTMARDKLWCEHLLAGASPQLLVIRPGFVVGPNDKLQRFEQHDGTWVWRGTNDPVQPVVHVEILTSLMLELVARQHTGIVRAGYSKPRVLQADI